MKHNDLTWTKNPDGEYNEERTTYKETEIIVSSNREETTWSYRLGEDDEVTRLGYKTAEAAKKDAIDEIDGASKLWAMIRGRLPDVFREDSVIKTKYEGKPLPSESIWEQVSSEEEQALPSYIQKRIDLGMRTFHNGWIYAGDKKQAEHFKQKE